MIRVEEINEIVDLVRRRPAWTTLLGQTSDASFFQTLEWLTVYWQHFGAGQKLRVLLVSEDGRPIGILPLAVRVLQRGPIAVRALGYPLDDWGTFYGPIGPDPARILELGLEHIQRSPRDWDFVDVRFVASDASEMTRTPLAMAGAGMTPSVGDQEIVALVDLAGDWNQYVTARGHKWRVNQRRSQRKLAELGAVTMVRYRPAGAMQGDDDPRWDLYDACEQIAQRSWQGSSTNGTTLSHERVRAFLRDAHAVAARAGAVDLCLLHVGGKPAAFIYNYHWQGNVFGLRRGHDPAIGAAGAGSVLMGRVIEDSFARGDQVFNLGSGYLDAKRRWLTRTVASQSYAWFPQTNFKAQAVRLARALRHLSKDRAAAL